MAAAPSPFGIPSKESVAASWRLVKKGSRVVTTSGIHGKILEVAENYIILESENSRLKLDKSAISKELSAQYSAAEK